MLINENFNLLNVYNYYIEFVMANPFIVKSTIKKDVQSLEMLKRGLNNAFDEAISYIDNNNVR